MRPSIYRTVAIALFAAGCAGTYTTTVDDGYGPDLVYAAPGVQVIADYDEPIFYSDNFYWRYSGGTWYRSSHYRGGWAYAAPPPAVLRIDRPGGYAHYRPAGWVGHRGRGAQPPVARRAEPQRGVAASPPPVYQGPARVAPPLRGAPAAAPAPVNNNNNNNGHDHRDGRGRHDDHDGHDNHRDGHDDHGHH